LGIGSVDVRVKISSLKFRLLVGYPPFIVTQELDEESRIKETKVNILRKLIRFPNFLSDSVKELLGMILTRDFNHRAKLSEIKNHDWFRDVNWNVLNRNEKKMERDFESIKFEMFLMKCEKCDYLFDGITFSK
jgi:serine/threonine protein kinase